MEKYKKLKKNNKFKISAPTWSDTFKLPVGPYSISHIQYYFQYILQKHNEKLIIFQKDYM